MPDFSFGGDSPPFNPPQDPIADLDYLRNREPWTWIPIDEKTARALENVHPENTHHPRRNHGKPATQIFAEMVLHEIKSLVPSEVELDQSDDEESGLSPDTPVELKNQLCHTFVDPREEPVYFPRLIARCPNLDTIMAQALKTMLEVPEACAAVEIESREQLLDLLATVDSKGFEVINVTLLFPNHEVKQKQFRAWREQGVEFQNV